MGFYQGEGRSLYLGEEFHHNRIDIVCSQISGASPALKYRWDAPRRVRTFMNLVIDSKIDPLPLISHRVPFAEGASLFDTVDRQSDSVVQAVMAS